MYCRKCGSPNDEGARFCGKCGAELQPPQEQTEKEKKVVTLYYYEDLTLKEISNILEVSESRVSQLHTRALQKMKTKMGNYMGLL